MQGEAATAAPEHEGDQVPSSATTDKPGPARPRRSAARDRILKTADRLFYDEGIHTVGVQRLVEEAAVTRVTFYRHFPSKDDLVAGYLEERADEGRRQITGLVESHAGDPHGALRDLGRVVTTDTLVAEYRGCPFINAAAEFAEPGHPARTLAAEQRAWVSAVTERLLREAGHPDPVAAAGHLMMLRTGAVFGAAVDGTKDLDAIFLKAWDLVIDGCP
jgi:AcrR family transcriptional regulator